LVNRITGRLWGGPVGSGLVGDHQPTLIFHLIVSVVGAGHPFTLPTGAEGYLGILIFLRLVEAKYLIHVVNVVWHLTSKKRGMRNTPKGALPRG
jgi:hypothetical protein